MNYRTDIIYEAVDTLLSKNKQYKNFENINLIHTNVSSELSKKINKKQGDYYLVDISKLDLNNKEDIKSIQKFLSKLIKKIFKKENITIKSKGLIVGLGNDNITPDSLGPKVIDKIIVTRHIFELDLDYKKNNVSSVCALSPGVMGTTGIETSDIIKAIIEKINIDYIIIIDALAAKDISRIMKTIQITNAGISPGSGVGNKRKELSKEILGVPVIVIGVPTVVDLVTLASNTIDYINTKLEENVFGEFGNISSNEKKEVIRDVLTDSGINMIVTPKEIDIDIQNLSEIISKALDYSLHKIKE